MGGKRRGRGWNGRAWREAISVAAMVGGTGDSVDEKGVSGKVFHVEKIGKEREEKYRPRRGDT